MLNNNKIQETEQKIIESQKIIANLQEEINRLKQIVREEKLVVSANLTGKCFYDSFENSYFKVYQSNRGYKNSVIVLNITLSKLGGERFLIENRAVFDADILREDVSEITELEFNRVLNEALRIIQPE